MKDDNELREAITGASAATNVDLSDPLNAFTVWSESPGGSVQHLGSKSALNDAIALGREHVNIKNIVILSANPKHGLTRLADDDRVKLPRGAYSGSGL